MTHDFLELPAFACLGLEKEDLLASCREWVPSLWLEFMRRSDELRHLECRGVWGLMSDPDIFLAPWGGQNGRHLASWQVPVGTAPFADWKIWEISAQNWMRIPCLIGQIDEALEHARQHLDKNLEWRWEGAVHEFYPETFWNPATDTMHLMVGVMPR
jgi:hypothetical protein